MTNELFPRVFYTRNKRYTGARYFGPFTSLFMVRTLLDMFKQLFSLRNCKLNITNQGIAKGNYSTCLEFHIKNCNAPCIGNETAVTYNEYIKSVINILKGDTAVVITEMKRQMHAYASNLQFEQAHHMKNRLELLDNYQSKSIVASPNITNVEVYSVVHHDTIFVLNFLKVVNGRLVQVYNSEIKSKIFTSVSEILDTGISTIRSTLLNGDQPSIEVIVAELPVFRLVGIKYIVPKHGEKKKLLELSEKNGKQYLAELIKRRTLLDPNKSVKRILNTMMNDLRLKALPIHIECFDNSNIQGTNPVSSCVVFKNGKPSKREYRHYNIKTVIGPDDFSSMKEVIFRRYRRLLNEGKSLPNLIIIDGGKGQLSAALESLTVLELSGKIPIIGIAKRLEEIYFPDDSIPIYLDKNSETLKVIQNARNEAHRFGISFHRDKRSKSMIVSELSSIKGIGNATIQKLVSKFGSVKNISDLNLEQLAFEIGVDKANKVYNYFHSN